MKSTDITKAYVGSTEVDKLYLGGDLVYDANPTPPTPLPYDEQYLTIEALESGNLIVGYEDFTYTNPIEYSINEGSWTSLYTKSTIPVSLGDKIRFRHISTLVDEGDGYSAGTAAYMFSNVDPNTGPQGQGLAFKVYGNIESLEYGDDFIGKTDIKSVMSAFQYLFSLCSGLTDASHLILPGLVAKTMCYQSMFRGCTSLVSAPELPATANTEGVRLNTLRQNCYSTMFYGCTSLVNAPSSINILELKGNYEFNSMFGGCTSLVTAPVIYAERQGTSGNVGDRHFVSMFSGCTSLNYIKCLYRTPNQTTFLNWVSGVAATGTFVKNPNMTYAWQTGASGIPSGWTVEDAQ